MMGGKTKRGAGGAAGEGGATGSEALRALKDVMRGLESGSQREGGAASGGGAVLQGGVSDVPSNGMYLYGAIVLAVQGDIQLDVITSMVRLPHAHTHARTHTQRDTHSHMHA